MEKIQCLICHDDVRVPVFFTCFPCPRVRGKPGCHSTRRVCLLCARAYLDLNKPISQRRACVKCILCSTKAYPKKIHKAEDAYEKDFMYMSIDKRADYECFHANQGCRFQGTQNELDRHIQTQCVYRMTSCRCGVLYRVVDGPSHFVACPYFTPCPLCEQTVSNGVFDEHLLSEHHKVICRHVGCTDLLDPAYKEAHENAECRYRGIVCDCCSELKRVCDMPDHLSFHVREDQENLGNLVKAMEKARFSLDASLNAFQRWMIQPPPVEK